MKKVIFALFLAVFAQNVFAANMAWDVANSTSGLTLGAAGNKVITAYKDINDGEGYTDSDHVYNFAFTLAKPTVANSVALEFANADFVVKSVSLLESPTLSFVFSVDGSNGKWSLANTVLGAGLHTIRAVVNTAVGGGQFNVKVHAVPVPAAVWLFGSALMGLVGVSRRRVSAKGLTA